MIGKSDTISREAWDKLTSSLFCFKCGAQLKQVPLSLTGTSAYYCENKKCSAYRLWQEGNEKTNQGGDK